MFATYYLCSVSTFFRFSLVVSFFSVISLSCAPLSLRDLLRCEFVDHLVFRLRVYWDEAGRNVVEDIARRCDLLKDVNDSLLDILAFSIAL